MTGPGPLLVIDTATREAVVALADADGPIRSADRWTAGYRHGEELLVRIEALLEAARVPLAGLGAIVVGTGPGAFTGLRVGIASAKGLAHATRRPIVGVPTGEALLHAAAAETGVPVALLLPAGPSDRVLCRPGETARLLPGGEEPDVRPGEVLIALDLEGRAPSDALDRGHGARAGLAVALAVIGGRRLRTAGGDDLARLAPEYVTLPRGVRGAVPDDAVQVARSG